MSSRRSLRSRTGSESLGLGQCQVCSQQDSNQSLITCNICANQFHAVKCLSIKQQILPTLGSDWNCPKCKSCEVCGRRTRILRNVQDNSLMLCKGCDRGFHKNCIEGEVIQDGIPWYCIKCSRDGTYNKNQDITSSEEESSDDERPIPRLTRSKTQSVSEKASKNVTFQEVSTSSSSHDSEQIEDEIETKSKSSRSLRKTEKRKVTTKSEKIISQPKKREEDSSKEEIYCCRVTGCDSKGHLSGKFSTHSTTSTCPIFHNFTAKECEERYQRRSKRKENMDSPKIITRKSPYKEDKLNSLLETRKKDLNNLVSEAKNLRSKSITSREPNLKGLSPIFDYEMFREAQAKAAELMQEQMKDGPPRKNGLKKIEFGKYEMDVWYSAPYPSDYLCLPKIYICEFCLKYFNSPLIMQRHVLKCPLFCPPGNEIYRKGNISVFEIDGEKNRLYCQNLCLLAKLFLDHKTLYYDVEPFRFYIMTESDNEGFHIIGYFSKEKNSFLNYNVSCILCLPPYQKQGYGKMLIDFSYLLTKVEGKVGSPEKPLSDLGLISYRSYWKNVILEYLCNYKGSEISIKDLSHETAINAYDIVSTLQALGMLKYWKGKHLVLTRKDMLDEYRAKCKKRKNVRSIDPSCLHWEKPNDCNQK